VTAGVSNSDELKGLFIGSPPNSSGDPGRAILGLVTPSLRRHDPDQVQRVTAVLALPDLRNLSPFLGPPRNKPQSRGSGAAVNATGMPVRMLRLCQGQRPNAAATAFAHFSEYNLTKSVIWLTLSG